MHLQVKPILGGNDVLCKDWFTIYAGEWRSARFMFVLEDGSEVA